MERVDKADQSEALQLVEQAIQLAMGGGHEDIRQQAILSEIKIKAEQKDADLLSLHGGLDSVERYARLVGMPRLTCRVLELRARLQQKAGDMRAAGSFAAQGLQVATRYGMEIRKANLLLLLAEINYHRGQKQAAQPLLYQADSIARVAECHYIRPRIGDLRSKILG
jgi:hypothetical protein